MKHKRILTVALVILSLVSGIYISKSDNTLVSETIYKAEADTVTYTTGYYKTNCKLNMRNAPSLSGKYLCYISKDKVVDVTSIEKDSNGYSWGKIAYYTSGGFFNGYVRLDNLTQYDMPELNSSDLKEKDSVDWLFIDISQWQNEDNIDWYKLKEAGINGVILRIAGRGYGYSGSFYYDDAFQSHYNNARAAGLHIGCYFFSYALTAEGAKEEAEYVLKLTKQYGVSYDLPIFIDIEDADGDTQYKHYKAGKTVCTAVCNSFCKTIEDAGYYAGIYCNLNFANTLIDSSAFKGRATWIAHYSSKCGYSNPDMWQYTPTGILSGYSGYLDVDHCYKNFPKLIAKLNEEREAGAADNSESSAKIEENTRKSPDEMSTAEKTEAEATAKPDETSSEQNSSNVNKVEEETTSTAKQENVPGDVDGDGEVTVEDARKVLRGVIELEKLSTNAKKLCDLDNDGTVTVLDARLILRIAAGMSD